MRDLAGVFQALSDVNRIRILMMLQIRPLCVCEVTSILQLATSTVSRHLSILRDTGFVTDDKEGKWVNYSLVKSPGKPYIDQLLSILAESLSDNGTIKRDAQRVLSVDRDTICG